MDTQFRSPLTGGVIAHLSITKDGRIGVDVDDNIVLMPDTIKAMEEWSRKAIAHVLEINKPK